MKKLLTMLLLAVMSFGAITTYALPQTKKDGTPDKRYKTNKVKLKSDGTPDKRYKSNATAAPAKADKPAKAEKPAKDKKKS
ncbi:hypothetical protein [Mucilaginibacter aquaedulcis]|uniref:hypothetical protein n=1 Tax=Mucilaginibacter aquaedulcis TaxID=1187081 RepID=UPI0025B5C3AC|nr:hypothetical protein [Mucilaginibacter aquaedulcis]MDN3551399.1 hypothetical protein [Mucilaginibacter aquaedulcis]